MMSKGKYHQRWFKKYIKAIHRHDQCQAMADDFAMRGHPKAATIRNLQRMYAFLAQIAAERIRYYQKPTNET